MIASCINAASTLPFMSIKDSWVRRRYIEGPVVDQNFYNYLYSACEQHANNLQTVTGHFIQLT